MAADDAKTLVDVVRGWALRSGDRVAMTFLVDGEVGQEVSLTYAELDLRARATAAALRQHGQAGDRVLLLFPSGMDFVVACLGCFDAGMIAVPASPPMGARVERSLPRLRNIAADARPQVILTTADIRGVCEGPMREATPDLDATWIELGSLPPDPSDEWHPGEGPAPDALAVLQYTSGSTTTPRGVMVRHRNLLSNLRIIQHLTGVSPKDACLTWLPHYHDMGLIGGLLEPLYAGSRVYIMSPTAFLRRPGRWLKAISHYRCRHSGGPNFAYDLVARKIRPEERSGLDLSCWAYAYNGAEPIYPGTLDRFVETFGPSGFLRKFLCPCYGMAEATLVVTSCAMDEEPVVRERPPVQPGGKPVRLAGSGRPFLDTKVAIVDPESRRLRPEGEEGEIWISGSSVAGGYWGRDEDTKQTFGAHLADMGDGPFLRTGDLGMRIDGELFVTGRIKDLIIVEGLNHYPQDIERTVEESSPEVRPGGAATFTVEEGDSRTRLVIAVELERAPGDPESLASTLRWAVSDAHRIRVDEIVFLRHGGIPKTSSGKVQRRACREAFQKGTMKTWKGLPGRKGT